MEKSIRFLLDSCGKCPPIAKIEVANVSTTEVQLSWISNDSIKNINLFFRKMLYNFFGDLYESSTDVMKFDVFFAIGVY